MLMIRQLSVGNDTELVALRVRHHLKGAELPEYGFADPFRAEFKGPGYCNGDVTGVHFEVDVQPVLDGLGLGHGLE